MPKIKTGLLNSSMLMGVAGVAVLAGAVPAFAQTQPEAAQLPGVTVQGQAAEQEAIVDDVIVTGSRIRRDPTNAPTPLIQVTREELLSSGQSTMIDQLATVPALSNSLVPSDTIGTNSLGLNAANLRSLGTVRTLTLVDGRRHVSSSGGSLVVDVDNIPRLLIDSIEVVTGGASSVYGADAVSGVLNFKLRKDFEGLEIDANYGMINQDGQANKRVSVLAGANILDDRLNLWAFGEREELDELRNTDIDWLRDNWGLVGTDVDPTNPAAGPQADGVYDAELYSGIRFLQRVRWSVVNLANNQPASPLSDPDIPYFNCPANGYTNGNCTAPNPGYSYVFEGSVGRPVNFGHRIGAGLVRNANIGGDGEDYSEFAQFSFFPQGENTRFAGGANWALTDDLMLRLEAKHVSEESYGMGQASFFDVYINNARPADQVSQLVSGSQYHIRLSDNAFLPDNVRTAIENNRLIVYTQPTIDSPGVPTGQTVAAPFARAALRGLDRYHNNSRDLTRFVASLEGSHDRFAFLKDVRWDMSYTYGEVEVYQTSTAIDTERQAFASDAIVDTAGVVNGRPGEIVCRVQVLQANNVASMPDLVRGGDLRDNAIGRAAIDECQPLNIFGKGNQSQEAIDYIRFVSDLEQWIEQEQALASVSGELWDFWGAGRIGAAVGVEYRREFSEAIGYDDDIKDRLTQASSTGGLPAVQYESNEIFAEVAIPLLRDSWLGRYAELSGSYRRFDYTTVGEGDVYGVNLTYRPIPDIGFKTSFNTSFRTPNLSENFAPYSPAFANFAFSDPCSTANINAAGNAEYRTNRIANCTALAAQQGLSFDFAGNTLTTADDFDPTPLGSGSVRGSNGGNPNLAPETSESFTFSTVLQPRMFPNFSLVLDYYEIELTDVIQSISANIAANNCVNGPSLNQSACATIFRNNPSLPFAIGAPVNDLIGAFIEGSINYAAREVRGLDFTARYSLDLENVFGRNLGSLEYKLGGSWLIEQKEFNNAEDPNDYVAREGTVFYPRIDLTSSLTYTPNDVWSVNWTMDWMTSQDNPGKIRTYAETGNVDARAWMNLNTGNFARHDVTVKWNVRDDLTLRAGVVNLFDAEQPRYFGNELISNFDPYGRRFSVGLNYRPF